MIRLPAAQRCPCVHVNAIALGTDTQGMNTQCFQWQDHRALTPPSPGFSRKPEPTQNSPSFCIPRLLFQQLSNMAVYAFYTIWVLNEKRKTFRYNVSESWDRFLSSPRILLEFVFVYENQNQIRGLIAAFPNYFQAFPLHNSEWEPCCVTRETINHLTERLSLGEKCNHKVSRSKRLTHQRSVRNTEEESLVIRKAKYLSVNIIITQIIWKIEGNFVYTPTLAQKLLFLSAILISRKHCFLMSLFMTSAKKSYQPHTHIYSSYLDSYLLESSLDSAFFILSKKIDIFKRLLFSGITY